MSGKCSIHVERVKIPAALENHNNRVHLKMDALPYVDASRSHLNYDLVSCADYDKAISARLESAGLTRKIRKDSPRAGSFVINAPTKDNHALNKEFFKDCLEFLNKICGGKENIIAASVHNDEKTPHLHCVFVPIIEKQNKKNKSVKVLSYSDFFGKREQLRDLQSNFFWEVGLKYGLERGEPSDKKHISTREYRANAARVEKLNVLENENNEILNEIERAKNIKTGWQVENNVLQNEIEKERKLIENQKKKMEKDLNVFEKEISKKKENLKKDLEIMENPFENAKNLQRDLKDIEETPVFFRFFRGAELARKASAALKTAHAAAEKAQKIQQDANKKLENDYYSVLNQKNEKKIKELENKIKGLENENYDLRIERDNLNRSLNNLNFLRHRVEKLEESQNQTQKRQGVNR